MLTWQQCADACWEVCLQLPGTASVSMGYRKYRFIIAEVNTLLYLNFLLLINRDNITKDHQGNYSNVFTSGVMVYLNFL